jgi:predicted dehydrogenase
MENNWKKLKILIAGCGSIGKRHVRVLTSLGVENIMVFDNNQEQVETLIKELSDVRFVSTFKKGLEVADATFILTPTKLHIPMATEAVKAGCHVFIEKPLSVNMEGVKDLEGLAEKTGRKVMIGLCTRYHEGIIKAKQLLDSGKIGRLVSIRNMVGEHFPDVHPEYKSLYYAKYSGAFELMHDLDLAIWFAGQPVKNVFSVFGSFSDIDIEAPDVVEFLLGFQDRCTATVHLDFFQKPRRRIMELIGTKSDLIIDFTSWDEYTISLYNAEKKIWEAETFKSARDDMFRDEDREFLESIAYDKPIPCNIQEACKSLRVIEAAQMRITELM